MKPLIEAAISDLCSSTNTPLPGNMVIADLGCSSGPNAQALVSIAVEAIKNYSIQFERRPPEVSIFLNDLPNNDFNMVVKSLVTLRQSNEPVVVTSITPGSFYERLLTSGSLHLVCSSSSLHWLSKAPEVLTRNHIPAYNIDEHARREMLPMILESYAQQFKDDFTRFRTLRAKELLWGGRMVISITGRHSYGTVSELFHIWEPIVQILSVMALEGVINKAQFDSFYMPMYGPSSEELRAIIQEEGSFSIKKMLVHNFISDVDSALFTPSRFMYQMRAVFEPIIVQHFGEVMDEFMRTAEQQWSMDGILRGQLARLVMCCEFHKAPWSLILSRYSREQAFLGEAGLLTSPPPNRRFPRPPPAASAAGGRGNSDSRCVHSVEGFGCADGGVGRVAALPVFCFAGAGLPPRRRRSGGVPKWIRVLRRARSSGELLWATSPRRSSIAASPVLKFMKQAALEQARRVGVGVAGWRPYGVRVPTTSRPPGDIG